MYSYLDLFTQTFTSHTTALSHRGYIYKNEINGFLTFSLSSEIWLISEFRYISKNVR